MTEEDKQLISEYIGWNENPYWWCEKCKEEKAPHHATYVERCSDCGCPVILKDDHNFDANDAALCIQEMQKRGEWQKFCATGFVIYFERERPSHVFPEDYIAWLFNAENFFNAMAEWIKEGEK